MITIVVCGLLGAGKTTFIRNIARDDPQKTVVLVNDFGAAGIDGEIFSAGGIEAVELPSGCVCCTLKFDLITTIRRIMERFAPERLVIEPSGVASPSGVLEALESAGVGPATVVDIVDATEFVELYESGMYGSFFEDQIASADLILVNKTDVAEEEKIAEAMRRIQAINPAALVLRSVNAEVRDPSLLHSAGEKPAPERSGRGAGVKGPARGRGKNDHLYFETLSFRLNKQARLVDLSRFFHDLATGRYGTVARAKALIQAEEGPYRFDVVYGKVDEILFDRAVKESRVVVIGEALNRTAIEDALAGRIA